MFIFFSTWPTRWDIATQSPIWKFLL